MVKNLRDYQKEIALKANSVLEKLGVVYITAEVRTGKTLMALETARLFGAKKILFCTKKKAISSIESDYANFQFSQYFSLIVINNESIHKIESNDFDLVISDEHHRMSSYPKPSKITKNFKDRFGNLPMIFLSGTACPEGQLQLFHQFWISKKHPFGSKYFYTWFNSFGFVKKTFDRGFGDVNDYSNSEQSIRKFYDIEKRKISKKDDMYKEKIEEIEKECESFVIKASEAMDRFMEQLSPYMISFTQKEAGFTTEVKERILTVTMKPITYKLCNKLRKDRVVRGEKEVILADTPVKLMNKTHQLYSGTIKFEGGNSQVIDDTKAIFIKENFKGYKIGIFYKFKAELDMLKNVFGDMLCEDIETFDTTKKNIALQILSGREGISLKNAKYLIFMNLDFSATSYWQARDRLSTMDRLSNEVFWVFSKGGIEHRIYKAVQDKKDYTLSNFIKEDWDGQ